MAYDFSKEADETTNELSSDIEKLGVLTNENIREALPERTDQDKLKQLIEALNSAADERAKRAVLTERLGEFSVVAKKAILLAVKAAV